MAQVKELAVVAPEGKRFLDGIAANPAVGKDGVAVQVVDDDVADGVENLRAAHDVLAMHERIGVGGAEGDQVLVRMPGRIDAAHRKAARLEVDAPCLVSAHDESACAVETYMVDHVRTVALRKRMAVHATVRLQAVVEQHALGSILQVVFDGLEQVRHLVAGFDKTANHVGVYAVAHVPVE